MQITVDAETLKAIKRMADALEGILKALEAPSPIATQEQIDKLAAQVNVNLTELEKLSKP